jgi:hypothetical protein
LWRYVKIYLKYLGFVNLTRTGKFGMCFRHSIFEEVSFYASGAEGKKLEWFVGQMPTNLMVVKLKTSKMFNICRNMEERESLNPRSGFNKKGIENGNIYAVVCTHCI